MLEEAILNPGAKFVGAQEPEMGAPQDAKIVMVGEAPGKTEERTKVPFTGRAGKHLDEMLKSTPITRKFCYVTNVVKERPAGNKISRFIKIGKNVKATPEYYKYHEHLIEELRDIQPNVVVAFGRVPLYALTGKKKIGNWRGSILECIHIPGLKVIPTYHPAAALRQYIWSHIIIKDLRRAHDESKTPDLPDLSQEYILHPSFAESVKYLEECKEADLVAFDIEVSNGEVSCISFSYSPDHAISIPFVSHRGPYFIPPQEVAIWKHIAQILEDPDIRAVGHNVTFDSTFLFRKYGIKSRNLHDTMVAHAVLYPDLEKGLDFITSNYTKIPYYKDSGKSLMGSGHTANEQFWLYNAKDSIVLQIAFPSMMDELDRLGNRETYERQRRLIEPLLFMTEKGIHVNTQKLAQRSMEAEADVLRKEEELRQITGQSLNPNSPKQLKEFFYEEQNHRPYKNRSTGKPTTNRDALKRLARKKKDKTARAAKKILEIRKLSKLKNTYLDAELDPDGRLRSSMNPVGTRYGRFSSSKTIFGTGMNMQNLPYDMRQYLQPDPGFVGYEVDLSQAENRVVAYLGPDQNMIEAFESGQDIHSKTASLIFGGPVEKEYQSEAIVRVGRGTDSQRAWGKKANHALNYGMHWKKFSFIYEIPEKEGEKIWKAYHDAYPGVHKMHEKVRDALNERLMLENLFGRRYKFMSRWGQKLFNDAYAFIPQSTVADKLNEHGVLEVYYNQEAYKHLWFQNQVHDSIWFQIPREIPWERHAEMLWWLQQRLEQPLSIEGRSFSIPADIVMYPHNYKEGIEIERVGGKKPLTYKLAEAYAAS